MYYEKLADAEGHLYFEQYRRDRYPQHRGIPHYHSSVEIYLMAKGDFPISIGGEQRILKAGEIAFVDGHTPHFCGAHNLEKDFEVFVIVASTAYFDKKSIKTSSIASFTERSAQTEEIIQFVQLIYNTKARMNHEMRLGFVNLLLGMILQSCKTDSPPRKEKTNLTVEIMRYIDTEYKSEIDLSHLSKKFGYEPTYISRVFNKYAGVNLHQYLNQTRYIATRKMLAEFPDLTVANAALACGFRSIKTYYRVAKLYQTTK